VLIKQGLVSYDKNVSMIRNLFILIALIGFFI